MSEVAPDEALPVPPKPADEAVLSDGQFAALRVLVESVGHEAVRAALNILPQGATRLGETRSDIATAATVAVDPKDPEFVETDPRLSYYHEQWKQLNPQRKGSTTWKEVARRLLNNKPEGVDRLYIDLAKNMKGGGILIGVDKEGNPLIADKGKDPLEFGPDFCDKTYEGAIKAALFTTDAQGKEVANGYEFFEDQNFSPSDEMRAFKEATGHLFVEPGEANTDPYAWRGIWLKSKVPSSPRLADFLRADSKVLVSVEDSEFRNPLLGVRRLLRVR